MRGNEYTEYTANTVGKRKTKGAEHTTLPGNGAEKGVSVRRVKVSA